MRLFSNPSPDPLPLLREGGRLPRVGKRGVSPLSINLFPSPFASCHSERSEESRSGQAFEGEGDKGGEVSKHSIVKMNCPGYLYVKLASLTSPPISLIVGIKGGIKWVKR